MTGHFEYPGPDEEFVLMQRAAEVADEVAGDLAAELINETEALHALGSSATRSAVEEMLATVESNATLVHDQTGFGDSVEADLANGDLIADQATAYLQARTPKTGVTMAKVRGTGIAEPDMPFRVALDVTKGLLVPVAMNTPKVSLVKRPQQ